MSNSSSISHFLLLALADTRQLQLLHFCLFLGISLAALLGNGLIISAVACGHHLHTPMFFFLLNLALTDLGSICTTVPKAMHNSLWDTRNISYTGCAAQEEPVAHRTRGEGMGRSDDGDGEAKMEDGLYPLRKVPMANPEQRPIGDVSVPLNTGDVREFKKEMGRLLEDPIGGQRD
ncbi:hypothetical protein DUI87_20933 [Hirundo rustica rustica]|uniref:G-protein coupled receptors family 1 profile domain-containing protein n=1 Tax=Hirundo rustica rustica TaxID=333673 RepID=A0A3M0JNV3_HIRRU|nr:hypothetical protein DUI87_20933 [Hirundo rustica rustica]